ncbi:DUF1064 domain-containing protein [Undibacterium sp. Rencai35W]|uniref:DUF1064 domain-containing protein n=1 Tax=Undibacterium sp. Rencai35W TaxID=3413046 RepID=UPI003BF45491
MLRVTPVELLNLKLRVQRGKDRKVELQRGDSKYRNQVIETTDGRFDSKAEHRYWCYLKQLEKAKQVGNIRRQVVFELAPSVIVAKRKRPPMRYVADFVYWDCLKKCEVVADVKGAITEGYRIKRHLMKSVHNIDILEIQS